MYEKKANYNPSKIPKDNRNYSANFVTKNVVQKRRNVSHYLDQ